MSAVEVEDKEMEMENPEHKSDDYFGSSDEDDESSENNYRVHNQNN